MQAVYRQIHKAEGRDITPNLPKSYPTSVLIGCVDVVACVPVSTLNMSNQLGNSMINLLYAVYFSGK